MGIGEKLEPILVNLGKNNKPTYVAMGVATAKGIFRPIFTMADKKQDENTKKYAAFREGLTELIAIPVYWGSGKCAELLANKFAKPKDMSTDLYKKIIDKDPLKSSDLPAHAKDIRKNAFKMRTSLTLISVSLAAVLVIPALCSATIKPLMKLLLKQQPNENKTKPEVIVKKPSSKNFKGKYSPYTTATQIHTNPYMGVMAGNIW